MLTYQLKQTYIVKTLKIILLSILFCFEAGTAAADITVDAKQIIDIKLKQGFLHGISNLDNEKTSADIISRLNPEFWRLSTVYPNTYKFVMDNIKASSNTKITFNISDAFFSVYGNANNKYYLDFTQKCKPDNKKCIASFEQFEPLWKDFIEKFMVSAKKSNLQIDYYDVFSEPDVFWHGMTQEQAFAIFKATHDIIRKHRPDAKIVAPSTSRFDKNDLSSFLAYIAANNLKLDVLSWHEFDNPEDVLKNTNIIRPIIDNVFARKPRLEIDEIHINEYAGPSNYRVPGWSVGWLYYLEKAGIDGAARGCWTESAMLHKWSDCRNGLDGLLLSDNKTPQNVYWVYRAYAQLGKARILSESSSPRVVAMAGRDDNAKEIRMIIGNYDNSGGIAVNIKNYPYNAGFVQAEIKRISIIGANISYIDSKSKTLPVSNGNITLQFNNFASGDAYSIVLTPK